MQHARKRPVLKAVLFAWLLVGCSSAPAPPFETYFVSPPPYTPARPSSNAYDGYLEAANQTYDVLNSRREQLLMQTTYTETQKRRTRKLCERALRTLSDAIRKKCDFTYQPGPFGKPVPERSAWRLLGKCLRWEMDEELAANRIEPAIRCFLKSTKIGFDLTGGGPVDASLGLSIANEVRVALVPAVPKMTSAQLRILSQGLKGIWQSRPPIAQTISHGELDMMQAIQVTQECYRSNDYTRLEREIGNDAKDPIEYLRALHTKDGPKRLKFFSGFAGEANREAVMLQRVASSPEQSRKQAYDEASKKLTGERPWKKLARHFLLLGRPLLKMNDATMARTQMLILDAEIQRTIRQTQSAPKSLDGFTSQLTVDPFTGRTFVYHADGSDYTLYSTGTDGTDNNGEYDETYSTPDLRIERPAR